MSGAHSRRFRGRFSAIIVGSLVVAGALSSNRALADPFTPYQLLGSFPLPTGAGPLDALPDGRIIVLVDDDLYVETKPGVHSFVLHGTLPSADLPSFGAAFLRVSPNGMNIAVGNNGGAGFSNYLVGVFTLTPLAGTWFSAAHFDGEWINNTQIALTAGDFVNPSVVTVLDTTSPIPAAPVNPTIVDNIGGASGGIAFDSAGNLYTGNGFQTSGPSGTGAVKAFALSQWTAALSGGPILHFETDGILIVDILSASPLAFDAHDNLFVGGGDFSSVSDFDFAALVNHASVSEALMGMGPVNVDDSSEVRRLDPDAANGSNFFGVFVNPALSHLYVRDGSTADVHLYQDVSTVPAVSDWGLLCLALTIATAGTLLLRSRNIPRFVYGNGGTS